jgi:hypothetical protein
MSILAESMGLEGVQKPTQDSLHEQAAKHNEQLLKTKKILFSNFECQSKICIFFKKKT